MTDPIRIILVDDHALVRDSLSARLDAEPDLTIVGTAGAADSGLELAERTAPDIVLMDVDMPGMSCFDAAGRITKRRPDARVIFLSAFAHDHYIDQALQAKARGYVTKSEPLQRVIEAIRQVAAGKVWFSDKVRSRLKANGRGVVLAQPVQSRISTLSARETEVLRYLARGLSKKEIGQTMHVSVKTVEGHAERLMSKLDIHDRVALARFAIREGLADA